LHVKNQLSQSIAYMIGQATLRRRYFWQFVIKCTYAWVAICIKT